jgi:rod shape determining protein RodA
MRHEQFEKHSLGNILRQLHIDIPLFVTLLLISILSLVILYSAGGQNLDVLIRQATRVGLAFLLMILIAHIEPYQFKRWSVLLFNLGVVLLLFVLLLGEIGKGAQRWLELGAFRFQPSEMIKITTPMMIAWYLSEYTLPPKPRQIITAGALIMLPTLLIAKQPDLGTALLVASSGAAVIFFRVIMVVDFKYSRFINSVDADSLAFYA